MAYFKFSDRHIGPSSAERKQMLDQLGRDDMDSLIDATVPPGIRITSAMGIDSGISEEQHLADMAAMAAENEPTRSFIGLGYYSTIVPSPILRNILQNPGWYTAYTPYQAEISQGRLEALLNFQTMVSSLTGLPIANASLLDEATAAAEAMLLFFHGREREQIKADVKKFFVSQNTFPQTIDVIRSRAIPAGIELEIGDPTSFRPSEEYFGMVLQYPAMDGSVEDISGIISTAHDSGLKVAVATDLMALTWLRSPGEMGADVAFGSAQRFGVPMGYGGPHAAFFSTTEDFKRLIPGRIIGVSLDRAGNHGYRMALQTREQHIRRDKATSNICTAQALLAVMASMYAVYHGPDGLRSIAGSIHGKCTRLANALKALGLEITTENWFDTIRISISDHSTILKLIEVAGQRGMEFHHGPDFVQLSTDEVHSDSDLQDMVNAFAQVLGKEPSTVKPTNASDVVVMSQTSLRSDAILDHPVFARYHTESELMRYMKRLENKDISLTHGMIPLGSCTMKLNAASTLIPITMEGFGNQHPFSSPSKTKGYQRMFKELEGMLAKITGLPGVSLQPNSGAQGEFAGLMVIREKHIAAGDSSRDIVLIPQSAHGTNPASAVMAGMKVVVVKCDDHGNIDVGDLRLKVEKHSSELAALMVTYPSTHGVFEESIIEITGIIHNHGGLVYMDGANMNAQVGLTSPGAIGADVCHLNLHKTFAIPHGGGGPGMGPICCTDELKPFLPGHPLADISGPQAIPALSAAPWGSALILLISYGYIRMLGEEGLTESTRVAILNANYIKARLSEHYPVLYTGNQGTVAHELILDCRSFKKSAGIEVADIAKRLIDHGFHAPTVSFPVAGTLMIEPTESEDKAELDRFCDAMITIRKEIQAIEDGVADMEDNLLKMAPHTAQEATASEWTHPYSREEAIYPTDHTRVNKYWPPVARIDNAYGDRNLICTCPPLEEYMEEAV
jgi:glycine dehydrogenase